MSPNCFLIDLPRVDLPSAGRRLFRCSLRSMDFHGVGAGQSAFLAFECAIFLLGSRTRDNGLDPRSRTALRASGPCRRHGWPHPSDTDHADLFPHRVLGSRLFRRRVEDDNLDTAAARIKSIFDKCATARGRNYRRMLVVHARHGFRLSIEWPAIFCLVDSAEISS
jgi:hypothetical protein